MINDYSPLKLAYIGDAVFELMVRDMVVRENGAGLNALNKQAVSFVKAGSQARIYHRILPFLSEEEAGILRRGRNAKPGVSAKNATVADYRHATGLEALFGYLYLEKRDGRLAELFELCVGTEDK